MPIETLALPNFSPNNITEEGELSADAAANQAVATLLNPALFFTNDYLVTNPGEETGELKQIQSVGSQSVTFTTNYALQHRNHERVVKVFGNQIRSYRTADVNGLPPADTSFTSGGVFGTVTIDPDDPYTYFTDNAGGTGYWYKFTYYNQTLLTETDISLAEPIRGGGYGHLVSIEDIRDEAGLEDTRRLADTQVATRRAEAESEVKGACAAAGYTMPLQTGTGVYYIPAIIRSITRVLAAGLILSQNFGITKPDSAKDGAAKQKAARALLSDIQLDILILLDSNDQALAKTDQVSGWPDATTASVGTDGVTPEPSAFSMSMKF